MSQKRGNDMAMQDERKLNSEVKVQVKDLNPYRKRLKQANAEFRGIDHQKDTYFKVSRGRLKLREGNIENALIYYDRDDQSHPKKSEIILLRTVSPELKAILFKALTVLVIVEKQREIYFMDNAKFHLDHVPGLGYFVEIEVMGGPDASFEALTRQLHRHVEYLKLPLERRITHSYSDMLLMKTTQD